MRKFCQTIGAIAFLFASTNAYSDGFSLGVSGSMVEIEAKGSESLRTTGRTTNGTADNQAAIGSIFAEYTWNGLTFGLDYIPVDADISEKVQNRSEQDYTTGGEATPTAITNKVNASIEDHITAYLTYPLFEKSYVKAGFVTATVKTSETLGTGSTYGNDDLTGYMIGVGVRGDLGSNLFMKAEVNYTDYEELSITSSGNNTVKGDIDVNGAMIAIGYNF